MQEQLLYTSGIPITCVYIGGSGRNGSTLLGLHLQRSKDVFFAGELTHIWERCYLNDELCGCGVPFSQCDFWREVTNRAFGVFSRSDAERVRQLRNQISSFLRLPHLLLGRPHVHRKTRTEYCDSYVQLARSIAAVAGVSHIVDSSKYPTDLAALQMDQRLAMRVVHVVRDCQAVVFSWKRKKRRSEIHWKEQLMPRYSTVQTALGWKLFNIAISRVSAVRGGEYRLIRYEDIVLNLQGTLTDLLLWLGCDATHLPTSPDLEIHSVAGNPCRFTFDPTRVRLDDEWSHKLSTIDRIVVKLLCGREQDLYGY
jgi:hypothetical protein